MPFSIEDFLAVPRVASLHLSPDGTRLVATVQTVAPDGKRFAGALWEIDPAGARPARRLTHSAKGEAAAGFLPDGSILFTSPRPDVAAPDAASPDAAALYVLPAVGGEPRRVCAPGGGVDAVRTGRGSSTVVLTVPTHPGAASLEEDAGREKARKDAGVEAMLLERYPMHWWDHVLAGRAPHYMALGLADLDTPAPVPRDLTPQAPWHGWLADTGADLSADGRFLVTGARLRWGRNAQVDLVRIDLASGEQRVLQQAEADHDHPVLSPDGRQVACIRYFWGAPDRPAFQELLLVDADSGETRPLAPEWDGTFTELAWAADGTAVFVGGEERGHGPVYRVDLDGTVTRLTASGSYASLCPSPDGSTLYALRSHIDAPPAAVALDTRAPDQEPRSLRGPADSLVPETRLEELTVAGSEGTPIHAWLVLPNGASAAQPAPLALLVHGGPFASWHGWHWRWNPHVLAARGYAVLLPDPHLSTGYGRAFVDDAWSHWATRPFADVMACVDAAVARPDLDAERTAALGGSYGGYMANWIAGHSDRFRAIVTHASAWALDQMHGTTDYGPFLEREFGSPVTEFESWMARSPHRSADSIRTPMLVIHGDRDRRVPSAESVRLWTDLQLRGVPSQMLWFPDENHWVLKPQNARIWYETVLAFLDHHVCGEPWRRPELL
jgi:dipeptidyl aminopeptidase/acylaminoacyl peptidase